MVSANRPAPTAAPAAVKTPAAFAAAPKDLPRKETAGPKPFSLSFALDAAAASLGNLDPTLFRIAFRRRWLFVKPSPSLDSFFNASDSFLAAAAACRSSWFTFPVAFASFSAKVFACSYCLLSSAIFIFNSSRPAASSASACFSSCFTLKPLRSVSIAFLPVDRFFLLASFMRLVEASSVLLIDLTLSEA